MRTSVAALGIAFACIFGGSAAEASAPSTPAVPASASASGCANANLLPSANDRAQVNTATLCLVNRVRAAHRLRALRANAPLGRVASKQVSSMVRSNYFSDVSPSGKTPLSLVVVTPYRAHTAGISVGQNIAWGTGNFATPAHIVAEWMASPPHRKIILSSGYRDTGLAVTPAVPQVLNVGSEGATYAMEFGVRRF